MLHLTDISTRYSAAWLIKIKRSEEIICNIFLLRISYFVLCKCLLSDNGGEFNNDGYQQMNEKLDIETCTTALESSFSNGTVEYYNGKDIRG